MNARIVIPGRLLGDQLRSGIPELVAQARAYIDERAAEAGAKNESQRAIAAGVSFKTWRSWINDGLIDRIQNPVTHHPAENDPIKLQRGKHWVLVEWVPHPTPSLRARGRTVARVTTSAGGEFTLATTEGHRFAEALESVGWTRE